MKHTFAALLLSVALVGLGVQSGLDPATGTARAASAIFISPADVTLQIGQFSPMVVQAADGTPIHDVILTIMEPSVAEIDSDAVHHGGGRRGVRGRTPGSTVVTATSPKGVAQATVRVVGKSW